MGYPLHQTLYSSHYIDRLLNPEPESFEEAVFDRDGNKLPGNELLHVVLRAFCLGVIKTCDCVHYRISTEKHFEVSASYQLQIIHRRRNNHLKQSYRMRTL